MAKYKTIILYDTVKQEAPLRGEWYYDSYATNSKKTSVNFHHKVCTLVWKSGLTTLSYTALSLTPGTTYQFKVKVKNIYGDSSFSSVVSILAA